MSEKRSTPKIMRRAGELRLNPTPAEAKIWSRLRAHRLGGVGFRRQHAIGKYIADFCAPGKMLIIELDGSQHLEQEEYDIERTAFLESKGYKVLRFHNNDVMKDIDKVLEVILENFFSLSAPPAAVAAPSPSPNCSQWIIIKIFYFGLGEGRVGQGMRGAGVSREGGGFAES